VKDETARTPESGSGAFTLVELLVVISIIAVLAAMTVGVAAALRGRSTRDRTRLMIERLEMALDQYREQFGHWPAGIPDAAAFSPAAAKTANASVARALYPLFEFDRTSGKGHVRELYVESETPVLIAYFVDGWFNPNDPEHDLDVSDSAYSLLNFALKGFNAPEIDIWSNGPDGHNDRDNNDMGHYGDDLVNWGPR